jgi:hypothetical protein
MIQSAGSNPEHDLTRRYFRFGPVTVDQFVYAAMFSDINGLHYAVSR